MSRTALIVVDMLNAYEHVDAEKLTRSVEQSLPAMEALIKRVAGAEDIPTIYVNDNFGAWTSNRDELMDTVLSSKFKHLVEPIAPAADTLFVVKARHSIFYQTPLEYLLQQNDVERIVLIGQVTEQCILYSALDAYIRHFQVTVPRDAVAHIHEHLADAALELIGLEHGGGDLRGGGMPLLSGAQVPTPTHSHPCESTTSRRTRPPTVSAMTLGTKAAAHSLRCTERTYPERTGHVLAVQRRTAALRATDAFAPGRTPLRVCHREPVSTALKKTPTSHGSPSTRP